MVCLLSFAAGYWWVKSTVGDVRQPQQTVSPEAGARVFLGEFASKEQAQSVFDQLKQNNLQGSIVEQTVGGKTTYTVIVSCYSQEYADGVAEYLRIHNAYGAIECRDAQLPQNDDNEVIKVKKK